MSYLNIPRLHFTGSFQADPSTVNNNDANYDPTVHLSNEPPNPSDLNNTSVYWNPNGTHNWKLINCTVRSAANEHGAFTAPSKDPIIGAGVLSSGTYPAKIVDLDPDNQAVSQIWGLQIQINIPDPKTPGKTLASMTATMPPTAFGDLWNRSTIAPRPGMATMCASFQAVLQDVKWVNATASPLLAALQKASPNALSIRFNVDSFQADSNQSNFTYGRVVGTIGPVLAGEAPRSTPRRLAPVSFQGGEPSIMSTYGPAGAAWDAARRILILDLGNCIPTNATPPTSGPSVPTDGWPIITHSLQLTLTTGSPHSALRFKNGSGPVGSQPNVVILGNITFDTSTYLTYAGVVEIPVAAPLIGPLLSSPLTLSHAAVIPPIVAVQEDSQGRYVDVDLPFLRLNPGDKTLVHLWATRYGEAWDGAELDVGLVPQVGKVIPPGTKPTPQASNGGPWPNAYPQGALKISNSIVITDSKGVGTLALTASDPGTPRTYPDGESGPDGQVYWITGSWALWGKIFLFPGSGITNPPNGTPINVLIFSKYAMPSHPNWDQHVGPILSDYARMYPYMKGIVDLGNYDVVVSNAAAIREVLNLPSTDPHHMPIVRDLSRDKLAMINQWFKTGMPKSAPIRETT